MSSARRRILVAVAAGLVIAAIATAVAARHLPSPTVSIQAPAVTPGGGGFQGRPTTGGLGGAGFGGGRGFGDGRGFGGAFRVFSGGLSVAATYLGISESTLQSELAGGKTLAQVAKAKSKTAAGLVAAMVTATRKQLEAAVASGRFTEQQEATIVASLEQRYQAMVDGTLPSPRFGGGFGGGFGDGGTFGGGQGGGSGTFGGGSVTA